MVAERFRSGEQLERYGYPDRPVREPVLQSIASATGMPAGLITRNSYGCVVLPCTIRFRAPIAPICAWREGGFAFDHATPSRIVGSL
jgi:hypothetical protein